MIKDDSLLFIVLHWFELSIHRGEKMKRTRGEKEKVRSSTFFRLLKQVKNVPSAMIMQP